MKIQSKPNIKGWGEYVETEKYYEARINQKMEEIKALKVNDEVLADIGALLDVYYELKTHC